MQEFLGADYGAFRKRLGLVQDVFGNGLHGLLAVRNIYQFLTKINENTTS
jgi:hypothetical protein